MSHETQVNQLNSVIWPGFQKEIAAVSLVFTPRGKMFKLEILIDQSVIKKQKNKEDNEVKRQIWQMFKDWYPNPKTYRQSS